LLDRKSLSNRTLAPLRESSEPPAARGARAKSDYSKLTTVDLRQIIPATEDREWEFKAAAVSETANFGNFKAHKLPQIVSSLANSGGGQLFLDKRDGQNLFDDVPAKQAGALLEDNLDWLSRNASCPTTKTSPSTVCP
jgi:hypothetical protein